MMKVSSELIEKGVHAESKGLLSIQVACALLTSANLLLSAAWHLGTGLGASLSRARSDLGTTRLIIKRFALPALRISPHISSMLISRLWPTEAV